MDKFSEIIKHLPGKVRAGELMSKYTSFKTGGPADIALFPSCEEDLRTSMELTEGMPRVILGNCTNVLVGDGGIEGAVIFTGGIKGITSEGNVITSHCGNLLSETANFAASLSLSGMEGLSGIPGSVGGGVYMNAGAYDYEIKDVVSLVRAMDENGTVTGFCAPLLDFGYRRSVFNENNMVILSAEFTLKEGKEEEIRAEMRELNARRRDKQPLEYPSAGSTFKRPEGYYAGELIEKSGLKGFAIGGACVSEKHAGFVINKGGATSKDILDLIEHIRGEVSRKFSVSLQPEIKMIGRF
ncbi:MAG: UDP-N-acetylmuramate dehydrogenase [Eubacteriaceae bacterium]|nr:UDP-N-acetylmuramate dehydrogenase [Eubacteriaceae bacterium]